MPETARRERHLAALTVAAFIGGVALVPVAFAQGASPWANSMFDPGVGEIHTTHVFDIGGIFRHSDETVRITNVELEFEYGAYPLQSETCTIPANKSSVPEVDPDNPNAPPPPDAPTNEFRFLLRNTTWPCNGTYSATATATAASTESPPPLVASVRVAVPPAAVPDMGATVAGGDDAPNPATGATADDPATVVVTWEPVLAPGQYPDFVGYRVQRAGPGEESAFETISGIVQPNDASNYEDTIEAPGVYRYRVQSLRAGPTGPAKPVPSTDATTPVVEVRIAGPPRPTTTRPPGDGGGDGDGGDDDGSPNTRRGLQLPQVGQAPGGSSSPLRLPTATTIDPGFNETLDYGDRDGQELAGEGQSVIQTEGEGAGLAGPVAGALVLLGWAGHIAYLNRLAKQF